MKVLLLEDELMLQSAITEYLNDSGYEVCACEDGAEAYEEIMRCDYDLFIFDINIPTIDGLSLLEELHSKKIHVPTIFISAITRIEQISKAYELGCYDYLKKPFHLKELTLHIERLLKISDIGCSTVVRITPKYSYDLNRRKLIFDGMDQPLTRKHAAIVDILASHPDRIVDFDTLRYHVWQSEAVDNATIRAEIHRLRNVLHEDLIESIKGIGYRIKKSPIPDIKG